MEEEWVWWDIELKWEDKKFKNCSYRKRDCEETLLELRLRCKDDIKINLNYKCPLDLSGSDSCGLVDSWSHQREFCDTSVGGQ